MREIKFRCWNGKRMVYLGDKRNDTALWIAEDYWEAIDHFTGEHKSIVNSYKNNSAVLMQYTGLRDKNGKEIYEGDIVVQEANVNKWQVEWFRNAWRYNRIYLLHEISPVEIIGNIYENYELIK